ncbi:MAG: hypothetical protein EBX49_01595 [Synechococcaceae bacterium WB8_1B_136]|nr:hypothetical protein [Synechococcaceae bacterium WB8_1B_136]
MLIRPRLLLSLCLWCGISAPGLRAEELAPGPGAAPPERLEVREGWLAAQQLFRLPPWMELGLEFTAEPLGNPSGGLTQQSNWMQQTTATLAVGSGLAKSIDTWSEADHWRVNLTLNHYSGDPNYAAQIGAQFPLQQVAFPDGFWLSEVSVARELGEGWFGVKGGIVPLNPDFVAAPIFDYYVHSALNNTLNITLNDLPISPFAATGAIATLRPAADLTLRYGAFNLNSVVPIAQWLGVDPLVPPGNGWAQLLQLTYSPAWLAPKAETPLQACRTAAGLRTVQSGCAKPVTVQRQLPAGLIQVGGYSTPEQGNGLYGTVSWGMPSPLGLDTRFWVGGQLSPEAGNGSDAGSDDIDVSPYFIGGGLVTQGLLPGRPLDVFILGVGRSGINGALLGLSQNGYEAMVEVGYQLQLNQTLALQPTLQWIVNPGGSGDLSGIFAAGVQISLTF